MRNDGAREELGRGVERTAPPSSRRLKGGQRLTDAGSWAAATEIGRQGNCDEWRKDHGTFP